MTILAILVAGLFFYVMMTGKIDQIFDLFTPSDDSAFGGIAPILFTLAVVGLCLIVCFAIANRTIQTIMGSFVN